MVSEIVQSSSRRQFLTDLRYRRVGGIPPRPTHTGQAAVAGIEVGGHLTMIGVLGDLETHFPVVSRSRHSTIVNARTVAYQGTTARRAGARHITSATAA